MKRIFIAILAAIICGAWNNGKCQEVNVIPYPKQVAVSQSACKVKTLKNIAVNADIANIEGTVTILKEKMAEMGYNLTVKGKKPGKGNIFLNVVPGMANEAYKLNVKKQQVEIQASTYAGILYGIQTLLQETRSGTVKCGTIADAPRYAWRGYMLDVSRHFHGINKVKQLIDLMCYYKLNRFHWHLTDEQGWRLEIKAYPKLTTIGATGCYSDPKAPAAYYTQEQVKEVIEYAKQRAIEVIPEIDVPGHSGASNRAYPEYQAMGTEKHPDYCLNPGKEGTYTYLANIFKEVAALFPSPYIHIGGDEVSYGNQNWTKDPAIISLMQKEGYKTAQEVEGYFIRRIADIVHGMGKIMVGWDDVIADGIQPQGSIVTWWRPAKADMLPIMVQKGYQTILCPDRPLYLCYLQDNNHKTRYTYRTLCLMPDIYAFPESILNTMGIKEGAQKSIIGLQGNLWGEHTPNSEWVDFMTWPRLMAVSESGWTLAKNKSYESFEKRLDANYDYLKSLNIYYYDHRNPNTHPEPTNDSYQKQ